MTEEIHVRLSPETIAAARRIAASNPYGIGRARGDVAETRAEAQATWKEYCDGLWAQVDRDLHDDEYWEPGSRPVFANEAEEDGWRREMWQRRDQNYTSSCLHCRQSYLRVHNRQEYCSDECRRAQFNTARRERRLQARSDRSCDRCGEQFTPARSDARYCSTRCRVAAHRASSKDD
jgi:hypothetical protein